MYHELSSLSSPLKKEFAIVDIGFSRERFLREKKLRCGVIGEYVKEKKIAEMSVGRPPMSTPG